MITICKAGEAFDLRTGTCSSPACPAGMSRNAAGICACPAGDKINAAGKCVVACERGEVMDPVTGRCERKVVTIRTWAAGYVMGANGMCQRVTTACPTGTIPGPNGTCINAPRLPSGGVTTVPPPGGGTVIPVPQPPVTTGQPPACPAGEVRTDRGCVAIKLSCPPGQIMTPRGCEKPPDQTGCPPGEIKGPRGCQKPPDRTGCPPGEVKGPRGCVKESTGGKDNTPPKLNIPPKLVVPPKQNQEPPKRIEQILVKPLLVEPGKR